MKDIGATIRTVYTSLLGAITYAGQAVPFYTAEPFETTPNFFIVLQNIEQSEENNDQRWVSNATVTLDVITKQNMANSRDAVDNIAGQILTALLPNTYVDRSTADHQVMIRSVTSPGYVGSQNGSVRIQRKILIIDNHLIQKTT
jgi:hypothetical protein